MLTFASLFSGVGGAEVGAVLAGCQPIWAVEYDEAIARAHEAAFPDALTLQGDVRRFDPADVAAPDVLWASPPCQAYSTARKDSLSPREDADVGREVVRVVDALRPPVVLVENVPAYMKSPVWRDYVAPGLKRLGYTVDAMVRNASWHGAGTTRPRMYARASTARSLPPWPAPRTPVGWHSLVADLLDDAPPCRTPPPPWQVRSLQQRPPADWPVWLSGGNPFSAAGGLKLAYLEPDRTGPSLTASWKSMSGSRVLWPDGRCVAVTARMMARLMGFPDDFPLPDDEALAGKVVGNAVCPLVARDLIERFVF